MSLKSGNEEAGQFDVLITRRAEIYFYELAEYRDEHMSLDRAEKITTELQLAVQGLSNLYARGAFERNLSELEREFRYIYFEEPPALKSRLSTLSTGQPKPFLLLTFFRRKRIQKN